MLCPHLLKRLIVKDRSRVIDTDGGTHCFGPEADAVEGREPLTVRLHDRPLRQAAYPR